MTALTVTPNSQPSVADELNVQLRDLMPLLGYDRHFNLRERFKTFISKTYGTPVEKITNWKLVGCSETDFFDSVTMQFVTTYIMTAENAMAFSMYVDPAKGMRVVRSMNAAHKEPAPIPYFTEKSVNCRILAERYNRSIDSVKRTFARNREWIKEIGGSELHIEERGGELWFTEQYAACIAFGGGKKSVLVKAKAMVTYADNPMVTQDKLQPLLRLV